MQGRGRVDFTDYVLVVNGFSDLVVELWGDADRHARAAPGAAPRFP